MSKARFIFDNAAVNTDLYYATKFVTAHDPYAFFEYKNKKYLLLDMLEVGRAKKEAKVDKILTVQDYREDIELRKGNPGDIADVLQVVFKKYKITTIEVPPSFPISFAQVLKKRGFKVQVGSFPFYPEKSKKGPAEKKVMINAQKDVFKLFAFTEKILKKSKIKGNRLYYEGKVLTSEFVMFQLSVEMLKMGYNPKDSLIVACGKDGADPHNLGSGPLKPHQLIIVDIFPRSEKTYYCGDATRTFCKGKAPEKLKKQYNAVKKAQEYGIGLIKAGANGRIIHEKIVKYFEDLGYKTGEINGSYQGFIHGTGHGIGLSVHEYPPFIADRKSVV